MVPSETLLEDPLIQEYIMGIVGLDHDQALFQNMLREAGVFDAIFELLIFDTKVTLEDGTAISSLSASKFELM